MGERNDGGPAFPTEPNTQPGFYTHHGMSLRDYFAGQALVAFLGNPSLRHADLDNRWEPNYCAHQAYKIADAMLAQRTKDTTP